MDAQDVSIFIESLDPEKTKNLDLSNKDIEEIPASIARLTNLQHLDLSYNNLKHLPDEISQLTNLKTLLLLRNQLVDLPRNITQLISLQVLDVSYNELVYLPRDIEKLQELSFLDASYNQIRELPLEFTQLRNLKELHLDENPFIFPPEKIIKRGLYATMYYLNEHKRKLSASRVNIHIYNLPEDVQPAFNDYLESFRDIISQRTGNLFNFDLHFIALDTEKTMNINKQALGYIYDFIYFIKENVETMKYAPGQRPELSLFETQVRDLKNQINKFNLDLNTKMEEMRLLQSKLNNLTKMLE